MLNLSEIKRNQELIEMSQPQKKSINRNLMRKKYISEETKFALGNY